MTTYASCALENNQIILNAVLRFSSADWQNADNAVNRDNPIVPVRLLVDIGATSSYICMGKMQIFKDLGLKPKQTTGIITPSTGKTPVQKDVYEVGIIIGGAQKYVPAYYIVHSVNRNRFYCSKHRRVGGNGYLEALSYDVFGYG